MEPVLRVDASKQYSQGQEFLIVPDGTYGMYNIKFKSNGLIPDTLRGSYTHAELARQACVSYLALRDSILNVKERRAAVKVGKEEHAIKQAAKLEVTEEV